MFKKNINYLRDNTAIYHNDDTYGALSVELYPENKLQPLSVKSDFGDCQVVTSDLYDLFNQTRIQGLGADVVRDFIERNYPLSSPIAETISRMSDEEILSSIKPRNIQTYSELMMWSKYLNEQIEDRLSTSEDSSTAPDTDTSAVVESKSD